MNVAEDTRRFMQRFMEWLEKNAKEQETYRRNSIAELRTAKEQFKAMYLKEQQERKMELEKDLSIKKGEIVMLKREFGERK